MHANKQIHNSYLKRSFEDGDEISFSFYFENSKQTRSYLLISSLSHVTVSEDDYFGTMTNFWIVYVLWGGKTYYCSCNWNILIINSSHVSLRCELLRKTKFKVVLLERKQRKWRHREMWSNLQEQGCMILQVNSSQTLSRYAVFSYALAYRRFWDTVWFSLHAV